jgi:hypothetical protein
LVVEDRVRLWIVVHAFSGNWRDRSGDGSVVASVIEKWLRWRRPR